MYYSTPSMVLPSRYDYLLVYQQRYCHKIPCLGILNGDFTESFKCTFEYQQYVSFHLFSHKYGVKIENISYLIVFTVSLTSETIHSSIN